MTVTVEAERKAARVVFRNLKAGPRTARWLATELDLDERMLRRWLADWSGRRQLIGRLRNLPGGEFEIAYRLPEGARNISVCEEVADAA